jgi:kynureninase
MCLAEERGMRVASPQLPSRRGGTVSIDFPNSLEVSRELNDRDVCVDYRPGAGIRLSPHFYTRDEELERAFEEIDAIREAGSWRQWADRPAVVT